MVTFIHETQGRQVFLMTQGSSAFCCCSGWEFVSLHAELHVHILSASSCQFVNERIIGEKDTYLVALYMFRVEGQRIIRKCRRRE